MNATREVFRLTHIFECIGFLLHFFFFVQIIALPREFSPSNNLTTYFS